MLWPVLKIHCFSLLSSYKIHLNMKHDKDLVLFIESFFLPSLSRSLHSFLPFFLLFSLSFSFPSFLMMMPFIKHLNRDYLYFFKYRSMTLKSPIESDFNFHYILLNHWNVYLQWVNFIICKLYLDEAFLKKAFVINLFLIISIIITIVFFVIIITINYTQAHKEKNQMVGKALTNYLL